MTHPGRFFDFSAPDWAEAFDPAPVKLYGLRRRTPMRTMDPGWQPIAQPVSLASDGCQASSEKRSGRMWRGMSTDRERGTTWQVRGVVPYGSPSRWTAMGFSVSMRMVRPR